MKIEGRRPEFLRERQIQTTKARMDGWTDTHGWMDGRTDGRKDGWMDGWMDGWTDGLIDGWMERCSKPLAVSWTNVNVHRTEIVVFLMT